MAIQRMDHVGVVVDDLEAAMAFFVDLGMELEGQAPNGTRRRCGAGPGQLPALLRPVLVFVGGADVVVRRTGRLWPTATPGLVLSSAWQHRLMRRSDDVEAGEWTRARSSAARGTGGSVGTVPDGASGKPAWTLRTPEPARGNLFEAVVPAPRGRGDGGSTRMVGRDPGNWVTSR